MKSLILGFFIVLLCGCDTGFKTSNSGSLSDSDSTSTDNSSNNNSASTFCTPNSQQSCPVSNGIGSQMCNSSGSAWGVCGAPISCNSGYNLQNGACVPNVVATFCTPNSQQSCPVSNGTGSQMCNSSGSAWGVCGAPISCNSGYNLQNGACVVTVTTPSVLARVADLNSSDYLSWIMKSVCVNAQGNLLAADPYYGCPTGSTIRKIQVGDAMPYNNFNQMKYQISDSFVMLDKAGAPLYLHNFDYFPFNQYNSHSASDGFDVYALKDNVVSYSNTKDGGGYATTFFGANCSFGSGWVLFPMTNFLTSSQGFWPIAGNYWEQNGQAFSGSCPVGYSTNSLTSWEFRPAQSFGGINGNSVKTMQTIVSFHGYETDNGVNPTQNFTQNGHLEVYYFTREYGLTRWEVWTPAQQAINATNKHECNGSSTVRYKNSDFVIQYCHDWSNVAPLTTSLIPEFPLENSNLLQYAHFNSGLSDTYLGMGYWYRFGNSLAGNLINWSYGRSTQGSDAKYGSGFQYLSTNCGSTTVNGCGAPGSQAIYQDLPASSFCSSCTYLYGVKARTQSGTGTIQAAVQIISSSGQVLWQDVVQGNVVPDNGDGRPGEAESIYRSVQFVHKTAKFPSLTGASFVRFLIMPTTHHTFDIVDAWLNRFPERVNSVVAP